MCSWRSRSISGLCRVVDFRYDLGAQTLTDQHSYRRFLVTSSSLHVAVLVGFVSVRSGNWPRCLMCLSLPPLAVSSPPRRPFFRRYEDILDTLAIYSLLALAAYHNKCAATLRPERFRMGSHAIGFAKIRAPT